MWSFLESFWQVFRIFEPRKILLTVIGQYNYQARFSKFQYLQTLYFKFSKGLIIIKPFVSNIIEKWQKLPYIYLRDCNYKVCLKSNETTLKKYKYFLNILIFF